MYHQTDCFKDDTLAFVLIIFYITKIINFDVTPLTVKTVSQESIFTEKNDSWEKSIKKYILI